MIEVNSNYWTMTIYDGDDREGRFPWDPVKEWDGSIYDTAGEALDAAEEWANLEALNLSNYYPGDKLFVEVRCNDESFRRLITITEG